MIYKFGDKEINTKHVHAIGEPSYNGSGDFYVTLFFVGGKVDCVFKLIPEEGSVYVEEGLKLIDGTSERNLGNAFMAIQSDTWLKTKIYNRMKEETERLKTHVDAN